MDKEFREIDRLVEISHTSEVIEVDENSLLRLYKEMPIFMKTYIQVSSPADLLRNIENYGIAGKPIKIKV